MPQAATEVPLTSEERHAENLREAVRRRIHTERKRGEATRLRAVIAVKGLQKIANLAPGETHKGPVIARDTVAQMRRVHDGSSNSGSNQAP